MQFVLVCTEVVTFMIIQCIYTYIFVCGYSAGTPVSVSVSNCPNYPGSWRSTKVFIRVMFCSETLSPLPTWATVSLHFSLGNVNIRTLLYTEPDLHLQPHRRARQDTLLLREENLGLSNSVGESFPYLGSSSLDPTLAAVLLGTCGACSYISLFSNSSIFHLYADDLLLWSIKVTQTRSPQPFPGLFFPLKVASVYDYHPHWSQRSRCSWTPENEDLYIFHGCH